MIFSSAHAKINLGLEILNKRSDGYHNLNTVFCRISLHDRITVESSPQLSVVCTLLSHIPQEENIVFIAAEKLQREFNVAVGAKITIEKHIPIGAGLGGGSSDAAATLLALRQLWQLECGNDVLHRIGRECGADVPFFLRSGAALASGIGDELYHFDVQIPYWVLVVAPPIHSSTAEAYASLRIHAEGRSARPLRDLVLMAAHDVSVLEHHCVNDFEATLFERYPRLSDIKGQLKSYGAAYAQMSGSGSALFGLFKDRDTAMHAASQFTTDRVFLCSFVND